MLFHTIISHCQSTKTPRPFQTSNGNIFHPPLLMVIILIPGSLPAPPSQVSVLPLCNFRCLSIMSSKYDMPCHSPLLALNRPLIILSKSAPWSMHDARFLVRQPVLFLFIPINQHTQKITVSTQKPLSLNDSIRLAGKRQLPRQWSTSALHRHSNIHAALWKHPRLQTSHLGE